ncbi:sulfite exporter TauE/SafE family protein [Kocuria arenosa]|uniref:sulfite exporter TauE/SafE family protein n=1 Tax=Kocuria arenosa TaxID=3071446 RepID=UPI0034D76C5B
MHLSEVGTTLVSGAAHWKFGNVDWRVVGIMAVPGGIAAFLGAHVLVNLDGAAAKPVVSTILLGLGVYVLYRFLRLPTSQPVFQGTLRKRLLVPLAVAARGLIIWTNSRTLINTDTGQDLVGSGATALLGALFVLWIALVVWAVRRELQVRAAERNRQQEVQPVDA